MHGTGEQTIQPAGRVPPTSATTHYTAATPKPISKLRLTIKPVAPSPAPPSLATIGSGSVSKAHPPITSTPGYTSLPNPSSLPPYMPHPSRPMSSASSSSSTSSKPPVTRLPSINQFDSYHSTIPRLHHPSTLPPPLPPPMFLPNPATPATEAGGVTPTVINPASYRRPSPTVTHQLQFSATPIPVVRAAAPLLNPPSFDAFAAAAAAHTTKSNNINSQAGPSVSPASSHGKIDINPALLLNNVVHLS